jgi:hypothetical protein
MNKNTYQVISFSIAFFLIGIAMFSYGVYTLPQERAAKQAKIIRDSIRSVHNSKEIERSKLIKYKMSELIINNENYHLAHGDFMYSNKYMMHIHRKTDQIATIYFYDYVIQIDSTLNNIFVSGFSRPLIEVEETNQIALFEKLKIHSPNSNISIFKNPNTNEQ